eukprot:6773617-Prymnesium_polylepis.1
MWAQTYGHRLLVGLAHHGRRPLAWVATLTDKTRRSRNDARPHLLSSWFLPVGLTATGGGGSGRAGTGLEK